MPRDGAPPMRLVHPQENDPYEDRGEPDVYVPSDADILPPEPAPDQDRKPYRELGHDRGTCFFLTDHGSQVLAISGKDLNRWTVLMHLAPQPWWKARYAIEVGEGDKKKKVIDLNAAANDVIYACFREGIYDPDRVRGRGAWIDEGRAVLHLGNRLLVGREELPLELPGSRYVYEGNKPLSVAQSPPINNAQAHRLVQICCQFSWERPIQGTLLAGWIALAPICGALAWRPSIWLTGGAGSGKTTVQNKVIAAALGGTALHVQSKTSEAGIRQALGSDARPVIFDEAEREDNDAARRMQAVLDLARQSSSEGGAEIIKGTASQIGAKRFRVRSCFLFSSINVGLEHHADETRVTVLALGKPKLKGAEFAKLENEIADLLTPDFAAGLLARSVSQLTTIRANAETFARAAEPELGSRRAGDQIGALLAGAYSLHSTREITPAEATEFIKRHKWDEAADTEEEETDEARLLAHLMQHRVRVNRADRPPEETTLGLLAERAAKPKHPDASDDQYDPEHSLRQFGVRFYRGPRLDDDGYLVANQHPYLASIFKGTPWSGAWHRTLVRMRGANNHQNRTVRFGPGVASKVVFIPFASLERGEEDS